MGVTVNALTMKKLKEDLCLEFAELNSRNPVKQKRDRDEEIGLFAGGLKANVITVESGDTKQLIAQRGMINAESCLEMVAMEVKTTEPVEMVATDMAQVVTMVK